MTLSPEELQRVYGIRPHAFVELESRRWLMQLSPGERAVIERAESIMRTCSEVYGVRLPESEAVKLAQQQLEVESDQGK